MKQKFTAANTFDVLKRVRLDLAFVDYNSIEMEDVFMRDYPNFCDAFIAYATFKNGVELNDNQLEELNENSDIVYEAATAHLY